MAKAQSNLKRFFRQGDLYRATGTLVARGADGTVLAHAPVAAVAYWQGVERGVPGFAQP